MTTRRRIASLLASGTEIVSALRLADRLVAISHECDYPAEVLHLPRVTMADIAVEASSKAIDNAVRRRAASGEAIYQIDVKTLAATAPDLIITQAHCEVCAVSYDAVVAAVQEVKQLAGTQILAINPSTLGDIFNDIKAIADAAGCPQRADETIAALTSRVEQIRSSASALASHQRPRVVCIEWIDPVIVAANWMPELIEWAGGTPGLTRSGQPSTYTEWSDVVSFDPEVVVVMPCGFDLARTMEEAETLYALPGWSGLTAVRSGRVYAVDGNAYFNRSGPRIVDSLEILARLLHPKRFANVGTAFERAWARLAIES